MKKRKVFIILSLVVVCFTSLFAGGKKETDARDLGNKESWQESFDITEKKEGKYNIVVTAEDEGGNVATVGPYNIYIDPESDLPVIGITNPSFDMRVPGNLNIVGTCIDDDAVDYVTLIFDDDETNPVKADGKDFWSYYLDTKNYSEGRHKITAYGVDINGVAGHPVDVYWQLDRYSPKTVITNYELGALVAGKITLEGEVIDGNGIETFAYSIGGEEYSDLKFKYNKNENKYTFSLTINTKNLEDGPQVCWFKGKDSLGTEGTTSFLFFVDNTSPDIQLFYPREDEKINGVFTVAGSVYDTIGITKLSYELGDEVGDFDLIAGNPYWIKEFDIRGKTAKSQELIITAVDKSGNVSVMKKNLSVDLEADLPVVILDSPIYDPTNKEDKGPFVDDEFYIRGSIEDDDGVSQLYWSVDKNQVFSLPSKAVFTVDIFAEFEAAGLEKELKEGSHVIEIWAEDIHQTMGNKITIPFTIKGKAPSFANSFVNSTEYENGMEVHPEDYPTLKGEITSSTGLTRLSWTINDIPALDGEQIFSNLKGVTSFSIPLTNTPWGLLEIKVTAEDSLGRKTTNCYYIYETNLTKVRSEPKVVFNNKTLGEGISYGYFAGGNAVKAELIPATEFATVSLSGNTIVLNTTGKTGTSKQVKVQITTDKGLVYESEQIKFVVPEKAPKIILDKTGVLDGFKNVVVSGSVSTTEAVSDIEFGYRFLTSAHNSVNAKTVDFALPNFTKAKVDENGKFLIDLKNVSFDEGITIIEMYAKTALSEETYAAVAVSKVSPLPEPDYVANPKAKPPVAAAPVINWIEGKQVYYTVYYQDEQSFNTLNINSSPVEQFAANGFATAEAGVISFDMLKAGTNVVELKINDVKAKSITNKFNIKKNTTVDVNFDTVNGIAYKDGMEVVLPFIGAKEQNATIRVVAKAELPVSSISYKIADGNFAKLTPKKIVDEAGNPTGEYEAFIPLVNLPAEITDIEIFAEADKIESAHKKTTICILRSAPEYGLNDAEKITFEDSSVYNVRGERLLKLGEAVQGYANVSAPIKVRLLEENKNIAVSVEDNLIYIKPKAEGYYEDIKVVVTDSEGIEYTSDSVSFWLDKVDPFVKFISPKPQAWLRDTLLFEISAIDANNVVSVEYALNEESSWHQIEVDEETGLYVTEISLELIPEGLVTIDARVTDSAGKVAIKRMSVFRDVTAPIVETILPAPGDVINGETQVALRVVDNGAVVSGLYVLPITEQNPENEELVVNYNVDNSKTTRGLELKNLTGIIVGREEAPLDTSMYFRFVDAAGNVNNFSEKTYEIDLESDKPVAEIHLPQDMAIEIVDFEISGIVYDDDGESTIYYKIDEGDFIKLPKLSTSFSIPIPLASLTDNEHTITVYAEDMFGIKGDETSVKIRVSLEEPKGEVNSPTFEETIKGRVKLSGVTSDKNGIDKVQVSLDNGNTWNDVAGTEIWTYEFDSRVLQGGTHVVFLRVWDEYQIQGLYSSLINIDNTSPELNLELPLDDSYFTTGRLFLSGQTTDNIGLENLYLTIRNMDSSQPEIPAEIARRDLTVDKIINQEIDISKLPDGFYNLELTGEDAAKNITRVSRNIRIDTQKDAAVLDLLYPLNGEHLQGVFSIYGMVTSEFDVKHVALFVDGKEFASSEVSSSGYYKFTITPDLIKEGEHVYSVRTTLSDGSVVYSEEQYFVYTPNGPWINVSSFSMGDFAVDRPYLEGEAGYSLTEAEMLTLKDKKASKEEKEAIKAKVVKSVEISFDNGKTFVPIGEKAKWRYRIENSEMEAGFHFMVVRALMENGEQASTRMIIQIDKTSPDVKLISPGEGGRYNETIEFSGLSSDDVALKNISLAIRSGDKANYEVPAFIQGLYLDTQFWGATFYNVGAGLTFFDDNVKLQVQFGQFTDAQYKMFTDKPLRYGGNVFGFKLLANIGYVPFSYFFGPDYSWLSASFALGANFSFFTETPNGNPQILSALLAQVEFPRITLEKMNMFSTYALYTEVQIWSIPTDVKSVGKEIDKIIPQISIGLRVNVF